jgi:serine/threonine protein phosphatase PrpC
MGCCTSADGYTKQQQEQWLRRRLSVSDVEGGDAEPNQLEEDRGLINLLDAKTVVDLLESGGTGDRKMSISSNTDQGTASFSSKAVRVTGEKLDPSAARIGYTCRKGLKPESLNQDSWFVLRVEGERPCSIYGVFDGHGKNGHDVSNFVKENLPKLIVKDPRFMTDQMDEMLVDCFKRMQGLISSADRMKKISAQMSGTTCTLAIHDIQKDTITLAHVADSSAVLSKRAKRKCRGVPLTRDHKPNLPDERKRIESGGGRVLFDGYANHRVYAKNANYPGLNMSRCLGDLRGHNDCGLSCEPEVMVRELSAEDRNLLICSDGVWEFISPDEAVGIVSTYTPDQAMVAAEKLAKVAWDRWIREEGGFVVDDITVLCVHL